MADSANDNNKDQAERPAAKPCPNCRKPSVERFRPFCSARCADVDLNRWLSGSYAIPATGQDEDDDR
jgi:uncharacterized protein